MPSCNLFLHANQNSKNKWTWVQENTYRHGQPRPSHWTAARACGTNAAFEGPKYRLVFGFQVHVAVQIGHGGDPRPGRAAGMIPPRHHTIFLVICFLAKTHLAFRDFDATSSASCFCWYGVLSMPRHLFARNNSLAADKHKEESRRCNQRRVHLRFSLGPAESCDEHKRLCSSRAQRTLFDQNGPALDSWRNTQWFISMQRAARGARVTDGSHKKEGRDSVQKM